VQTQQSRPVEPGEDAAGVLIAVIRRWKMLAIGAVVGLLVGILVALLLQPKYRAEIKVVAVDANADTSMLTEMMGRLGGLADLAGLSNANPGAGKNVTLELLRSRSFARRFIVHEGIEQALLQDSDSDATQGKVPFRAFRRFTGDVRVVSEDKRSGIITVAMRWPDPEVAAKWANDYVDLFNADMRQRASADAQRNMQYLEKRLAGTGDVGVRQALYKLMEVELKNSMLADIRSEYAAKVIDRAAPPDKRDFASPNRLLIVAGATAAGIIIAMLYILLRGLTTRLSRTEAT